MVEAEFVEEPAVHLGGVFSAAEEDEDQECADDGDPAVEEDLSVRRDFWDLVPVRAMSEFPAVWVPWAAQDAVVVDDEGLHWQDSQEHDEGQEEEAQEPGLVHLAACRVEDVAEFAAVFVKTEEHQSLTVVSCVSIGQKGVTYHSSRLRSDR